MTAASDLQTLNVLVQVFATKYDFAVSNDKRHRHNIAQRKLLRPTSYAVNLAKNAFFEYD